MKKRLIAAFCLAAGLVVFVGCGVGGRVRDGETLIIATIGGPRSLDPSLTNDSASSEIMEQIYNTLFELDFETMQVVPSLAEGYVFENDEYGNPVRVRLFLRRGVLFHNGDAMTASDVKFTLDRASVSPQISHIASMIRETEIINDYELLVTLEFPFVPILHNLAHTAMSIVSERAVRELGAAFGQNPVGTGPMKMVNWVVSNRIELTRWENYWGELPRIRNITIRYIADDTTRLMELETGGIDIALSVQPHQISRVEAHPDLQMVRGRNFSLNFVGINTRRPPFDNLLVRQALDHAIDMEVLHRTIFDGVGAIGRGPISSAVWASAADRLEQREFNPERARQLLAEAGFPDGFSTTLITNDNTLRIDAAVAMQAMLANVGITLDINVIEWAAYLEMLDRGDSELFMLGWVTVTADPDYGLEIFHSRSFGAGGNYTFFSNPEVDRLLDAARQETDLSLRYEMYIEAQRIIHAYVPIIYMTEGETLAAIRNNVRGFSLSPAGHHSYWTAWLEE